MLVYRRSVILAVYISESSYGEGAALYVDTLWAYWASEGECFSESLDSYVESSLACLSETEASDTRRVAYSKS